MTEVLIRPVVLSGGSGSRLWPLSRDLYPKQLLPLVGELTMLQETLKRIQGLRGAGGVQVICNEEHRFLVAEQLHQINVTPDAIILEPFGRNTAPAIAIAALQQEDPKTVLLVLPSDHIISAIEKFHEHIYEGASLALESQLVTFGVVPDQPLTGYGYIEAGEAFGEFGLKVSRFVEKPNKETAEKYISSGNFFWNSGMFMFTAETYLEELAKFHPDILNACKATLDKSANDLDFVRLDAASFAKCPDDSIDYAVMEKSQRKVVIPIDVGWNDLGSWSSLWDVSTKDESGNKFIGDVLSTDSKGNFVKGDTRLVSLVGVENLVIVDTPDALLVAARDKVQNVKDIYNQIKSAERIEATNHRMVYRPWGAYDSIDVDEGFQVKRITVKPGASLSLQKHYHRAEHWIVVSGTAEVTRGEEVFTVNKNESTYIPMGEVHRLRNPGKIPLKLIEVQSGDYLGEDDIVRFEDDYGRNKN